MAILAAKPSRARLDLSHPLAQGIVGAWEMDESSGLSVYDRSGYNNTAAGQAGVSNANWKGSPGGMAYSGAGGTNERFQAASLSNVYDGTKNLTIMAILTNGVTTTALIPFCKYSSTAGDAGSSWLLSHANTGTSWRWGVCIGSTRTDVTGGSTSVGASVPQVIVGTWDGTTLSLYIDGAFVASVVPGTGGALNSNAIGVNIGGRSNGGMIWNGALIAFRIWNRTLSAQEIANLAADPWGVYRHRAVLKRAAVAPSANPGQFFPFF